MADERNRLRTIFDEAALLYDEARPGYPEKLFDDIESLSGIPFEGRILEIGCGTGQATVPFASRGYHVLCIELGENMAALARRNLRTYPQVRVRTGDFEQMPLQERAFDLAISATAFHWLDKAIAYPKVAGALVPGGAISLFWNEHVHSDASEDFFEAAQRIYEREAPEIVGPEDYKGLPRPDEVPDRTGEIQNTGLFGEVITRSYQWDVPYDTESYLRVLNTYSGHRSLRDDSRERLFRGIGHLIDSEYCGSIVKGYLTTLYVAHKK